jgi:[ribosomal protein S18]-alanine N-acetyltransferase
VALVSGDTLGSDITLRPATLDDVKAVIAIERLAFSDPWSERFFRTLPKERAAVFLVAEAESPRRIIGYIVAWYVVDEAEIANLAVADDARRHGVGARLVEAAVAEAGRRGVRSMYLEVRESNHAARALYAAHQFEVVGKRKRYYDAPVEDALVMRRALG